MRQNPLYPSVRIASKKVLPLAELRASMEGKRDSGKAAETVAQIWSNSLLPNERGAGYQFYMNALQSWLSNKTANTRRSYAGTLVNFFDFASRRRSSGGDTIQLVAPHQLNQSDVDEYVAHLSKPSLTPESLTNKDERKVFEWLLDLFASRRSIKASEAKREMSKEGIDILFPDYKVRRGFMAKTRRNYGNFDYIISALARKLLINKVIPPREATEVEQNDDYLIEQRPLPTTHAPSTQIQRLQALSSFWSHLLTDKKLGMSRRPGALEPVNPWTEASRLTAKAAPDNQIRKAARKMSVADLEKVSNKLAAERLDIKDPGFIGLKNILATRDELAVFFYTSTGLRRQEGMMARVENLKDTSIGSGKLLLLGGIRRKGRKSDEEVFVPMYVLRLRQHLYSLLKKYVDETEQYTRWVKENNDPDSGEVKMALMRRGHFQKAFLSALQHADRGPLIPALGRWGNAVYKAQEKGKEESVALFGVDLTQVPMDGRNLLDRMQRLARGKEDRKLRYHPHALRHLSVTMAEGVGDGSRLAQAIAGHRSASTTDIYRDMVSLQAAAVLKVDQKLEEIFARADALARGQAPVRVKEGESAVEAPVVEIKPVEDAAVQPESMKGMIERISRIEAKLRRLVSNPSMEAAKSEIADDLAESIHRAREASEKLAIVPVGDRAAAQYDGPIHAIGEDLGETKKKKKKAPLVTVDAKRSAEKTLESVPPSVWFTGSSSWMQNGQFVEPVFMAVDQVESTLASGKIFGPQVVSRYGFTSDAVRKRLSIVTSMRSYLPYIFYFSRATSDHSDVTVPVRWSESSAGIIPATEAKMLKNASKKPREKKARGPVAKPERLIYMPIMNLDNLSSVDEFTSRAEVIYAERMNEDPDKAKSMIMWLTIMMSMSRRVKNQLGDTVSWLGEEDRVWKEGESTKSALDRTRARYMRQPTADQLVTFLLVEGSSMYGVVGGAFRLEDEEARRRVIESRLVANIDRAEAFEEGDIGSFLSVYKLPDWITSEDPVGEMPDKDILDLKSWLRSSGEKFSPIEFSANAKTMQDFWSLVHEFAFGNDRTVNIPPSMSEVADEFNRVNQVDLLLGVRRCLRHLWEMKSAGAKGFEFRGDVAKEKIDRIWGLYWSWVLPSTAQAKARLIQSGNYLDVGAVRKAIGAAMVNISSASLIEPFESSVRSFAQTMVDVMSDNSITEDQAAIIVESSAVEMSKNMVDSMFPQDRFDRETANAYVLKIVNDFVNRIVEGPEEFDRSDLQSLEELMRKALSNRSKNKSFSFSDLESLLESETVDESALVASAVILSTIAQGLSNFEESAIQQELGLAIGQSPPKGKLQLEGGGDEGDKNYGMIISTGKEGSSADIEDSLNAEISRLLASAPKSFASSPWMSDLNSEIRSAQSKIESSRSEDKKGKLVEKLLMPILKRVREKREQFSSKSAPELQGARPPELSSGSSAMEQVKPKAQSYYHSPDSDESDETTKEVSGFNLLTEKIEPVSQGDPGWRDYSDNIEEISDMVEEKLIELSKMMGKQDFKRVQDLSKRAYGKAMNSRSEQQKADLMLGIFQRLNKIRSVMGMTPNYARTGRFARTRRSYSPLPPQLKVARSIRINAVNLIRWIWS